MSTNNKIKIEKEIDLTIAEGLFDFFDLLARFDYEDKQTEQSAFNSEPLVSAPRSSELDTNFLN